MKFKNQHVTAGKDFSYSGDTRQKLEKRPHLTAMELEDGKWLLQDCIFVTDLEFDGTEQFPLPVTIYVGHVPLRGSVKEGEKVFKIDACIF